MVINISIHGRAKSSFTVYWMLHTSHNDFCLSHISPITMLWLIGHRSLVKHRSWAADLANRNILAWRPLCRVSAWAAGFTNTDPHETGETFYIQHQKIVKFFGGGTITGVKCNHTCENRRSHARGICPYYLINLPRPAC